ncbi:CBS domain-containing protein [Bowmanella dokdonensis]|uniref:CBS domain-containing protein n=1 Tax=Bowmanella dokdonensis TaxID=751969 RepID=A0A939DJS3_9ALTE|nr:CBS domain-containing protein [Bowmanella dokdonensis]MBN7824029.1 CBS domain-containing protein [Bowmanella dokdonensis]
MKTGVDKIMTKRVVSVAPDTGLAEVKRLFDAARFHHLLVVENKQLVGILSDRDLFRALSPNLGTAAETRRDTATLNKKVHQIMSRQLWVLYPQNDIYDAINLFHSQKISCIPVVDENRTPMGIISWRDIIKLLAVGKAIRNKQAM